MSDQLTTRPSPPRPTETVGWTRQRARAVGLGALATLLLGAILGLVGGWGVERLWGPPTEGMVVNHQWYRGVISLNPPLVAQNLDQSVFSGVAWFVVLSVAAGFVVGLVAALFWAREELVTLAAVVVASVVGGFVMYAVASALAPPDPTIRAATAPDGTVLKSALDLGSHWIVLACPAGGLVALAAVFLMLRPRSSRRAVVTSAGQGDGPVRVRDENAG